MNAPCILPHAPIAIGVFDSGVGGLSMVRELMAQWPAQPLIYVADQARVPYGQRPLAEIRTLSGAITRFLLNAGARVIVIACNTASAAALHGLRAQFPDVPFIGMEPAVKPATEHTRTGHVGVIATAATFQGELFASLLDRYAGGAVVHTQICPQLVPLVEAGELDSPRVRAVVAAYLAPLLAVGIDQLVLGCTHYPFLRPVIEEMAGPAVAIIDPTPAVARQTGRVLAQHGWLAELHAGADAERPAQAPHRFYTSGDPARFETAISQLLGLHVTACGVTWGTDGSLWPVGGDNPIFIPSDLG